MGVSSIEERKSTCCLSPKIYQPAEEMDGISEFPRKKKMFSSSSFYEEPNAIYPTVEEQVELCRKIAKSLSDDCNLRSKGTNMFFKRVKKAEKWIVAESNVQKEEELQETTQDPAKMPYVRPSRGLPQLKLILDPRHLVDMKRLLKEGVDIVEHNAVSPEICHDLVKDLNSPTGRGAQLFAKRKKKSEEWVVDEEKVKALLQTRYQGSYSSPEPPVEPLMHPRVKALSDINSLDVADSVIRAAEAKVMTYPNAIPQVPIIESLNRMDSVVESQTSLQTSSYQKPSQLQSDAYKFRVPKGWTTTTQTSSSSTRAETSVLQEPEKKAIVPQATLQSIPTASPLSRTMSFTNFNTAPRAWNADIPNKFRPAGIKRVKPPSVLVQ